MSKKLILIEIVIVDTLKPVYDLMHGKSDTIFLDPEWFYEDYIDLLYKGTFSRYWEFNLAYIESKQQFLNRTLRKDTKQLIVNYLNSFCALLVSLGLTDYHYSVTRATPYTVILEDTYLREQYERLYGK